MQFGGGAKPKRFVEKVYNDDGNVSFSEVKVENSNEWEGCVEMYTKPPDNIVSIQEFYELALDRLKCKFLAVNFDHVCTQLSIELPSIFVDLKVVDETGQKFIKYSDEWENELFKKLNALEKKLHEIDLSNAKKGVPGFRRRLILELKQVEYFNNQKCFRSVCHLTFLHLRIPVVEIRKIRSFFRI